MFRHEIKSLASFQSSFELFKEKKRIFGANKVVEIEMILKNKRNKELLIMIIVFVIIRRTQGEQQCSETLPACCECKPNPQTVITCSQNLHTISITLHSSHSMAINCLKNGWDSDLPEIHVGHDEYHVISIGNCLKPHGHTLTNILKRLHITGVIELILTSESHLVLEHQDFHDLNTIKALTITAPTTDLKEDTLADLVNIKFLNITSKVKHLPQRIFQTLNQLQNLTLRGMAGGSLEDGIFRNQHQLTVLHMDNGILRNLTNNTFNSASLTELTIKNSSIQSLQSNAFDRMIQMKTVNLLNCHLNEMPEKLFRTNINLIGVHLNGNYISSKSLPDGFLAQKPKLLQVEINFNIGLRQLDGDFFNGSSNIEWISLQSNQLDTIPECLFRSQIKLKRLNLSKNPLKKLPAQLFNITTNLNILILSHNQIDQIPDTLFDHLIILEELHLDNNRIKSINQSEFKNLKNLKQLNLGNNEIVILPDRLPQLNSGHIDLSNNKIKEFYIHILFTEQMNGTTLDLSGNHIKRLTGNLTAALIQLNETKTFEHLKLARNPLECSCDGFTFVQGLKTKIDYENVTCGNKDGGNLVRNNHYLCQLNGRSNKLIILVLIAVVGMIVGWFLYFNCKKKIEYWRLKRNLCSINLTEIDTCKQWDAFISYSKEDEHFVQSQLVPELENEPNKFKLCLQGDLSPEQIARHLEQSRRTIIVLSNNFLNTVWNRSGLRAAHIRCIRITFVILCDDDDFVIDDVINDPDLLSYLEMNTCIKWGEDNFFNKLIKTLPHPPTSDVNICI